MNIQIEKAEKIKKSFLESLEVAGKSKKQKEFCQEILKLYSDKSISKLSIDTVCYLALLNTGIEPE